MDTLRYTTHFPNVTIPTTKLFLPMLFSQPGKLPPALLNGHLPKCCLSYTAQLNKHHEHYRESKGHGVCFLSHSLPLTVCTINPC